MPQHAAAAADNREQIDRLAQSIVAAHDTASGAQAALKRQQAEAKKQADQIAQRIEQERSELTGQLTSLKDDTTNKISQVSTDVGGVKTDVDGVKTDVASAKTLIDQHTADLKRVTGDMGVMSGLIATNSKDLDGLRALGERNYYEFSLAKESEIDADRRRHDRAEEGRLQTQPLLARSTGRRQDGREEGSDH